MRYIQRRKFRQMPTEQFGLGGWLKDNALDLGKSAAGVGAMFIPGMQGAGAGLIASGVGGMLTEEPEIEVNDPNKQFGIMNRQASINNKAGTEPIFFEKGGIMKRKVPGGTLNQVSSNAYVARGKSHEEGGIRLPNGEIEGNETIVQSPITGKTQVHSDELGVSDTTNKLMVQKGKLEEELGNLIKQLETINNKRGDINNKFNTDTNKLERNKHEREFIGYNKEIDSLLQKVNFIKRAIQNIDQQVEQGFNQQQQINGNSDGEKEFELGGRMDGPPTEDEMFFRENAYSLYTFPGYYPRVRQNNDKSLKTNMDLTSTSTNTDDNKDTNSINTFSSSKSENYNINESNNVTRNKLPTINNMSSFDSDIIDNPVNNILEPSLKDINNNSLDIIGEDPRTKVGTLLDDTINKENANKIAPFIDNIYNAFANKRLSSMDTPEYERVSTPTIDPYYNINPQLENIKSQSGSYKEFVKNNTNNTQVARSAISSSNADNRDAINELYAQKDNIERQSINRNLNVGAQVDSQNAAMQYRNDVMDYQNKMAGIQRGSANIANMANKIIQMQSQDNMEDFQMDQIDAYLEGQPEGVRRDVYAMIENMLKGKKNKTK